MTDQPRRLLTQAQLVRAIRAGREANALAVEVKGETVRFVLDNKSVEQNEKTNPADLISP